MAKINLLTCPFCGDIPEICSEGTQLELGCCVIMGIQKSDYLSLDEREAWDKETCSYPPKIEEFLFNKLAARWNTRQKQ